MYVERNVEALSHNHFAVESNEYYIFRVCVCSLSYPTCNARAPCYIVVCGLSGSTVFFPHYLTKGTILGKQYSI